MPIGFLIVLIVSVLFVLIASIWLSLDMENEVFHTLYIIAWLALAFSIAATATYAMRDRDDTYCHAEYTVEVEDAPDLLIELQTVMPCER